MDSNTLVEFMMGPYTWFNESEFLPPPIVSVSLRPFVNVATWDANEINSCLTTEILKHRGDESVEGKDLLEWFFKAAQDGSRYFLEEPEEIKSIFEHLVATGGNVKGVVAELRAMFDTEIPEGIDPEDYVIDHDIHVCAFVWSVLVNERAADVPDWDEMDDEDKTIWDYVHWDIERLSSVVGSSFN